MSETNSKKVAVIGAGWAGCAAAVELVDAGISVSLFEARTTPGGRARRIEVEDKTLDNGQHILLGAYKECFRLMKKVGINPDEAFLRLPLQMCYPPKSNGISFIASKLPAPFHLATALISADGLDFADKMALSRFFSAARWMGWKLNTDCAVSTLLERYSQTERLYRLLWRPLCIAALNTVPEQASAQIFLNVLRDSLGASRKASDMLIPKLDFSALFPDKALEYIKAKKGKVFTGKTVRSLQQATTGWSIDGETFDAVVVATSAQIAANLAGRHIDTTRFSELKFEPIHTCYFGYPKNIKLPRAFFALEDNAELGKWGQFVFDRGWLDSQFAGIFAVVISTSSATSHLSRKELENQIAQQLADEFHLSELASPLWSQTISEKHATFVCKPALLRPQTQSDKKGLFFAGDYIESDYPATLESAIRSGIEAAKCVLQSNKNY